MPSQIAADRPLSSISALPADSHSASSVSGRTDHRVAHDLTIVIPALNEEASIAATIQRCLDARTHICAVANVNRIEIIVVSDGSTDRTIELAQQIAAEHDSVSVIIFKENQGYGAAIKAGFAHGTGDLVAFLDADGTCDPVYFGAMCRDIDEQNAEVVLGSRMGPNSEMPAIRRIGNRIFAILLGALSGKTVEDTASGMRVIRRSALKHLYPLPDGLHFTPAMSARAMMAEIPIVEIPMDYAERVGQSKLRVIKDGLRFLRAIMEALLLFRPGRLFAFAAFTCLMIAAGWGLYPIEFYFRHHRLEEWMIYRILLSGFLLTASLIFLSAAGFADRFLTLMRIRRRPSFLGMMIDQLTSPVSLLLTSVGCTGTALWLIAPGVVEYLSTSHVTIHWSRVVAAVFLLQMALVSIINTLLRHIVSLWGTELQNGNKNV